MKFSSSQTKNTCETRASLRSSGANDKNRPKQNGIVEKFSRSSFVRGAFCSISFCFSASLASDDDDSGMSDSDDSLLSEWRTKEKKKTN